MSATKQSLDFEKPLLDLEKQLDDLMQSSANSDMDFTDEIKAIEKKIDLTKRQVYSDLSPWQKFSCPGTPTVHTLLTSSQGSLPILRSCTATVC